jgi:hypothetical protein
VLQDEALTQESGRIVRDPPQLGLQGLSALPLLRGQIGALTRERRDLPLALGLLTSFAALGVNGLVIILAQLG